MFGLDPLPPFRMDAFEGGVSVFAGLRSAGAGAALTGQVLQILDALLDEQGGDGFGRGGWGCGAGEGQ